MEPRRLAALPSPYRCCADATLRRTGRGAADRVGLAVQTALMRRLRLDAVRDSAPAM